MTDIRYELDGVPADLARHVLTSERLRKSLEQIHATGVRLVTMLEGWSNPRSGESSNEAFEIQILGRPGKETDTRSGSWGQCYVKLDGEWVLTQISVC